MTKFLMAMAMAFSAVVLPARAFAAGAPERLSDAQLDRVSGGQFPVYLLVPVLRPVLGPPVMRLPVEPPAILVNGENGIVKDVNYSLGVMTNGGATAASIGR